MTGMECISKLLLIFKLSSKGYSNIWISSQWRGTLSEKKKGVDGRKWLCSKHQPVLEMWGIYLRNNFYWKWLSKKLHAFIRSPKTLYASADVYPIPKYMYCLNQDGVFLLPLKSTQSLGWILLILFLSKMRLLKETVSIFSVGIQGVYLVPYDFE